MIPAIGAEGQRRPGGEQLVLAHVGESAALAARPAGVRHDAVALDAQRQGGVDQLAGLVAEVRERVRDPLEPVEVRARSPAADEHLGGAEGLAVLVVATPGNERRPSLAGGDHAVWHDRREGAHDRVVYAVADHTPGAAGSGKHGVDYRAGG